MANINLKTMNVSSVVSLIRNVNSIIFECKDGKFEVKLKTKITDTDITIVK
jgi:hypothetical protein